MTASLSCSRLRRVADRWASRTRDYDGLRQAGSVAAALAWAAGRPLPFFNGNILRAKAVQGAAEAAGCTEFLETGTSHAATAIGSRRFLGLPVSSCEINPKDYLISRAMTVGMPGIELYNLDSPHFLGLMLPRAKASKSAPLIYLDAHEGDLDPTSLPLIDEIRPILDLDSFVVLVDDFRVPGADGFRWGSYGGVVIEVGLISDLLLSAGISTCYFPAYAPADDLGFQSGFCLFWRSATLDRAVAGGGFPFDLLKPYPLAKTVKA